jgi:hypothetical protein
MGNGISKYRPKTFMTLLNGLSISGLAPQHGHGISFSLMVFNKSILFRVMVALSFLFLFHAYWHTCRIDAQSCYMAIIKNQIGMYSSLYAIEYFLSIHACAASSVVKACSPYIHPLQLQHLQSLFIRSFGASKICQPLS